MQSSHNLSLPVHPSSIHLSDYLAVLKRRKKAMLLCFFFLVGIVAAVSFIMQPVYQATSQIIIETPSSPMSSLAAQHSGREDDALEFQATQIQLLQSRELARRVVEQLEVWKDFPPSTDNIISRKLSGLVPGQGTPAAPAPQTLTDPLLLSLVIDSYLANLAITPVKGTQLVGVSFAVAKSERAAQIANTHARTFIDMNIEKSHAAAQQRLAWLETELKKQKSKVEDSLEALHTYQQKNNIVTLNERQSMVSQKLAELNTAEVKASTELGTYQVALDELQRLTREDNAILSLPEISQDEILRNLRHQLMTLKSQKSELAATYGPDHPKMIETDSRLGQVEKDIDKEIERLRRLVKSNRNRALAVEAGLRQQLETAKREAMALQEKQIAFEVLQRDADSNQKLYDILLGQAKEIGALNAFDSNNVRIVEKAEIPFFPARPQPVLYIVVAIVLGLFMGTGLAFFTEYMDNTVKNTEDTQRRLGLTVLGSIPFEKQLAKRQSPALFLPGDPGQAKHKVAKNKVDYYPAYHSLVGRLPAKIFFTQPGTPGQVILLESATMGEGKTTVTGCLAATLGHTGLRVLAMDCDFQRPALHHVFEIENNHGLSTAMAAIFSFPIDKGNLATCGVSDLFALIGLRKLSGELAITNTEQTMTAVFQDGHLLHLENSHSPAGNRLGTMLLRGGFLTEEQLTEALERNQRTGQPLGYILVNAGYLSRDRLQGPLKLQMEEQLQKLFSWRQGSFTFRHGTVRPYEQERIYFGEDYSGIIARLSHTSASTLLDEQIMAEVRPAKEPNVFVLPAGPAGLPGSDHMINFALLAHLLETLKQRFDVVMLDAPPLLETANLNALATLADGVVLVVKAGHLKIKTLNQATTRLTEANAKMLGAILNQVRI